MQSIDPIYMALLDHNHHDIEAMEYFYFLLLPIIHDVIKKYYILYFNIKIHTTGNFWCKGSQADKAIIPAKGSGNVRALYIARAPPWLKPPRTIRFVGIPAATSSAIKECTISAALRIPSSSSGPLGSKDRKSNLNSLHM